MILDFKRLLCSLLLIALTLATSQALAQSVHFSPKERHVIEMIDARAPVDSLVPYLADDNADVAWRAAVGMANIGDPAAREALLRRLTLEKRDTVLDAVIFALGALGPDTTTMNDLVTISAHHPNLTRWDAIGRVVPNGMLSVAAVMVIKLGEHRVVPTVDLAQMQVRLALRKMWSDQSLASTDELSMSDDAETRWRAAYVFSRCDDSAKLAQRLDEIIGLTKDLSSPSVRMFAVTALGRIHSDRAKAELIYAARGEDNWQVRVNIMNALGMLPSLDSIVLTEFERTVDECSKANPTSINQAVATLNTIERMTISEKLHNAHDSSALRDWLHSYEPRLELHDSTAEIIRAMTLPILARLGSDDLHDEIADINNYHESWLRREAVRAASVLEDSMVFSQVLASMVQNPPLEQFYRLEALDSMWERAKHHPGFRRGLEEMKFANAYRHMLIRISDLVPEPEIVVTALSQIEDSTIIVDKDFRAEAQEYLLGYLTRFRQEELHDQLMAAIQAAAWLKPTDDSIPKAFVEIYDLASSQGWKDIRDTVSKALHDLNFAFSAKTFVQPKSKPIDWNLLETSPDTILMNGSRATTVLYLDKRDAPLTALNMLQLTNEGYYSNIAFHRVVPNFVVQAGDRTRSGFGGPGYAIRTEIAPIRFDVAGMLGMASDGKDTEGSQWFVTLLPTPHLDERYTIFGRVARGIQNMSETVEGDELETIAPLRYR